jgi:hypothetical protein
MKGIRTCKIVSELNLAQRELPHIALARVNYPELKVVITFSPETATMTF